MVDLTDQVYLTDVVVIGQVGDVGDQSERNVVGIQVFLPLRGGLGCRVLEDLFPPRIEDVAVDRNGVPYGVGCALVAAGADE